ncbi:MAG: hypothetical protein IK075_03255, partial [Prevotella sp.]|nr:hypothetical protein [Prevotella sp.]
ARYNRVTAITEKPKILFALGIITFIDEANSVLKAYLKDLERHVCRDALALNFKELADKGYWLKDDRLRQEMYAFACKTLSSYGVTFALDGVTFEDTLQIYKVIEEKVEQMVALLKMVEAALRSASPQLYQNFYQNLRAQYNEENAINDHETWMSHSGKLTLEKLKSRQAQMIAYFINGGTLNCIDAPSIEEGDKVGVEQFKKQLSREYPYAEWFDNYYAVFCRTISWDGDIVVPDYYCAGLFIFQHWDQLTEKDIQAIFYLDKMLELIHEEMVSLKGINLPKALATPEARMLLEKARKAGYLDDQYQPKISNTMSAILADEIATRLKIHNKWKVFEQFWNRRDMYKDNYEGRDQKQSSQFLDEIKKILG